MTVLIAELANRQWRHDGDEERPSSMPLGITFKARKSAGFPKVESICVRLNRSESGARFALARSPRPPSR